MRNSHTPPLALTMGDPAGIGPEITVKAWRALRGRGPVFCVLGPAALYRQTGTALGLDAPVNEIAHPRDAAALFPDALPVIDQPLEGAVIPAQGNPAHGTAITKAIAQGVRWCLDGTVSGVVTNPITKVMLTSAGFPHPGHTEYLAALAGEGLGTAPPTPVMMLASPELRVVPLTIHVPVADVPGLISRDKIVRIGRIMADALQRDFGLDRPRIAVAGLNPHAGEAGTIGLEDQTIIVPAVDDLCKEGIDARGPLPADTLFHKAARARYDAALCMYHDQALIPIKTLDFERGVNVTLGLPFVRTSPDHGTAYDIAGKGVAQADNLIAAIEMAAQLAQARMAHKARG